MEYVLMEAENGQILIVDNNNNVGKKRVEALAMEGCKCVGSIESECRIGHLLAGFNKNSSLLVDELHGNLRKIRSVMEE